MIKNFEKYLFQDDFNDISSILVEETNVNLKKYLNSEILSKVDVSTIIKLIHLNGSDPFIKQEDICKVLSITKEDLLFYNSILKKSSELQNLLTTIGLASKFLKNTILPVIQSGSLDAFNKKQNYFPFKVGLFVGISCMFECTFCGRNYDAKYNRSTLDAGIEMYKKLIEEAPDNDPHRFYISGGLEPLTNPKIGEIINSLSVKKFKTSMYTNAYMLTEKLLNKNKEIFDLDYLRISLYGTNHEEYLQTTKHKNGYQQVFSNIPKYLKLKKDRGSKTQFGLNYIVLKKYTEKLEILIDKIIEINKEAGFEKNDIDFLTLREDFSVDSEKYNDQEKINLSKLLKKVDKQIKNSSFLKSLHIDYGFALDGLKKGYTKKSLADSFVTEEEFHKNFGVPHASVAVDLYGDVYMLREAAFLDRPGSKRYIIGNLIKDGSMQNIIENYNNNKFKVETKKDDIGYLDAWDHVVIKLANQDDSDRKFGIPFELGPISDKVKKVEKLSHKIHYSE
jgi:dTDP-4-amino-4,6-dideoxy-D-glucose ammonia-lyase